MNVSSHPHTRAQHMYNFAGDFPAFSFQPFFKKDCAGDPLVLSVLVYLTHNLIHLLFQQFSEYDDMV